MTAQRDTDTEATMKMPQLEPEAIDIEDIDPEATLVRDDWESTVIRRVAPHVAAVQSQVAEHAAGEARFGWEAEVLRRLAHKVQKAGV